VPRKNAFRSRHVLAVGLRGGHHIGVSTVEQITDRVRALPAELQQETLHYVDFLLARQAQTTETREWSHFSGEQLAAQYSEADAIYDQE
jgi:hypothetical protein